MVRSHLTPPRPRPRFLTPEVHGIGIGSRGRGAQTSGFWSLPEKGKTLMRRFGDHLVKFLRDEDGPTAVEYAVMLALIIVVCIAAVVTLGQNTSGTFANVSL